MNILFSSEGVRSLRVAWVTLLVGAAVAGGVAWGTHVYSQSEERSLASSRQRLSQAESRLSLARRERDDLATSAETYRQLSARGALRAESRLELIERLLALKATHRLAKLDYDVEPQRRVTVAGVRAEAVELAASEVQITLQALHEADALAFLRDLARPPSGFMAATDCSLKALDGLAGSARVGANCRYEWLSIQEKGGGRAR